MRPMRLLLTLAALAMGLPAVAQEQGPAPGKVVSPEPNEDLVGWYEVTLTIPPPAQCRFRNEGGEWRAVVEVTRGRRGVMVLHLEQLKSWFTQPVPIAAQAKPRIKFAHASNGACSVLSCAIRSWVRWVISERSGLVMVTCLRR